MVRLVLPLAFALGCAFASPELGDPCDNDDDCAGVALARRPICYQGASGGFCTITCDREERFCAERTSTACVREEVRYVIEGRGEGRCNIILGTCALIPPRTVCVPN